MISLEKRQLHEGLREINAPEAQSENDCPPLLSHELARLRALQHVYISKLVNLQKRRDQDMNRLTSDPNALSEEKSPPLMDFEYERLEQLEKGEIDDEMDFKITIDQLLQFSEIPRKLIIEKMFFMDSEVQRGIQAIKNMFAKLNERTEEKIICY